TRGQVLDCDAGGEDRAVSKALRVPARVDRDPVTAAGQLPGQRADAGGLGAEARVVMLTPLDERAAVVCDEGDPHHEPPGDSRGSRRQLEEPAGCERRKAHPYSTP